MLPDSGRLFDSHTKSRKTKKKERGASTSKSTLAGKPREGDWRDFHQMREGFFKNKYLVVDAILFLLFWFHKLV
jgi:hypothetical protein